MNPCVMGCGRPRLPGRARRYCAECGTCAVEGCERPLCARGWCVTHYNRWHKWGDPLKVHTAEPFEVRFWQKVDKSGSCWIWTGAHVPKGYGQFAVNRRPVYAHRFAYELHHGAIPDGMQIDHLCRTPACVNPDHLEGGHRRRELAPSARGKECILVPIIDIQRRLAEVGRIRLGEQVTTRSGKKAPSKLAKFRFTSPSAELIDQAAALYGGAPKDWQAPSGPQREVVTEATSIPVLIPPGEMAFSQWYEAWSGGGCQKRCDGRFDIQRDKACDCDPDNRECKPTTRVSIVLPEMAGVGLWRVETHGYYAATELGATVELLQSLAPGRLVPGRLRLDPRTVKRVGSDGKPQTRNYVVPVLDIEGTMAALGSRETPVAIEGPAPAGLTPVPQAALEAAPQLSIAAQLEQTRETPRRSNAAAILPPTGLKPGKPAPDPEAPPKVEPATLDGGEVGSAPAGSSPLPGGKDVTGGGSAVPPASPSGDTPEWFASVNRRAHALARSVLSHDKATAEAQWDALCYQQSGGRTTSRKELTHDEYLALAARFKDLSMGKGEIVESDDPAHLGYRIVWKEVA